MLPPDAPLRSKTLVFFAIAAVFPTGEIRAQQDAPPIDARQLLQALHGLRDQQTTQVKAQKQNAIQQVNAAAGSAERAVAMWEDAVRAVQFDGMAKEGAQFKAWRDVEGEALKEREGQNAVRLYFNWLSLTLQRSAGKTVKELLPAVINYTKDLANDQTAMEGLEDTIQREKEQATIGRQKGNQRKSNSKEIKKLHDSILNKPLGGSVVVQWLKLADWVNVEKWEHNPGAFDGIFQKVILPELRAERDPRVIEYWDLKLKKEGDAAVHSKLSFEIDKYNTQRRPALVWSRAQEFVELGQKNRAITEMFNVIKAFPTHPNAAEWISQLEAMLAPPAAAPASAAALPGAATSAPATAGAPAAR